MSRRSKEIEDFKELEIPREDELEVPKETYGEGLEKQEELIEKVVTKRLQEEELIEEEDDEDYDDDDEEIETTTKPVSIAKIISFLVTGIFIITITSFIVPTVFESLEVVNSTSTPMMGSVEVIFNFFPMIIVAMTVLGIAGVVMRGIR